MFTLGFSTIGCPDYTVDEIIAMAVRTGLTGVELRFVQGTTDLASLKEFSPATVRETRRRFSDHGLEVVVVDTSVRMNSLDSSVRRAQLESAKVYADIAVGLGAPYMRVFGGPFPEGQDHEETLDAIATGLGEVAKETASRGVQSLLETHDIMSTSASVLDLYARGAGDELGILWDSLHSYRHGETPEYTWSQLGPRIRHVHIKDSNTATAGGFDFALVGEGNAPVEGILNVLKDAGYDGFLHFEWEKGWHPEIAEPEIAIPHFSTFMSGRM